MRKFIIHVTDTHYAAPNEALGLRFARQPSFADKALVDIRNDIVRRKGAQPAISFLWEELLSTLEALTQLLRREGDPVSIVHTGDITQAGQISSMGDALGKISTRTQVPVHALVGNHDLWPNEFPAFAASRTSQQHVDVRRVTGLPNQYPDGPTSLAGVNGALELVLLNSAVADSLLNISALGKVESDSRAQPSIYPSSAPGTRSGTNGSSRPSPRLRIAAIHHPLLDSPRSRWRRVQGLLGVNVGMVLVDAVRVQCELISQGCALALCGHEHAISHANSRLCHQDQLLQLVAGCPTFFPYDRADPQPQFSVYELTWEEDDDISPLILDWYICELAPRRWRAETRYAHDGRVWTAMGTASPVTLSRLSGQKSVAPFA